jgi:TonB family protein
MLEVPETGLLDETAQAWIPDVRLLVELPSRRHVFFENLRDLVDPPELPRLFLKSAPAPFWHDVFVPRGLPWGRFLQSGGYHVIVLALLLGLSRFLPSQPQPLPRVTAEHDQVIYYEASEYLPPLDTRRVEAPRPQKADPALSRQPIISLPPEADNRRQTIVSPPNVQLKNDMPMPNIVAWNDRPQMPIGPAPLVPASSIQRIAPRVENSIVAPPPDLRDSAKTAFQAPQPAVIAPPASLDETSRQIRDINIAPSTVIAPAPKLAVAAQRALPGSLTAVAGSGPQVVPPPSVPGSSSPGSGKRVVALSLNPTIGPPPDSAPGNRRGAFAASPSGHTGATGNPGSDGKGNGKDGGSGSSRNGDLPAGLYVGKAANPAGKTGPVAGNPGPAKPAVASAANVPAPRVSATPRHVELGTANKLTEQERAVFGDRKFYALTLNMPNLNSAGGTWIVRFAEMKAETKGEMKKDSEADAAQLSAPAATHKVDPPYPIELMRENVAGTVILYAVIHADGTVGNVRVLRAVDDRLDRFAAQAVAHWQFQPAMRDGVPVDVEATFHIPFKPVRSNF